MSLLHAVEQKGLFAETGRRAACVPKTMVRRETRVKRDLWDFALRLPQRNCLAAVESV